MSRGIKLVLMGVAGAALLYSCAPGIGAGLGALPYLWFFPTRSTGRPSRVRARRVRPTASSRRRRAVAVAAAAATAAVADRRPKPPGNPHCHSVSKAKESCREFSSGTEIG